MSHVIPELLAPVGGRAQLEAAINNGADAVYMGGSLFNARINAENFTEESLEEAVDFAHENGVRVYITFNTLIKDSELADAFRYACRLYEMGADALIVQDAGLARLVRRHLPDFPLHLSTQGTVYNEQALELVRQMGFKRVVPARELSLSEVSRLCRAAETAGLEVEVFVHGALCMCYSGQCQMSRAFGGGERSGNRGLCAQPCRLLYTDDKGRQGYFLSPKDLCALPLLPELVEAGVSSFKIEGRLKSPEYVAVTTAVYRKYLDLYAKLQQGSGVIDISDCPDLGPVLFALAAALHGGEFSGTARLRLKESDRGAAMCQELAKFGIETEAGENSIRVMPGALRRPREALCGHNDHRIVMALSLLAAQTGGRITGAEAVRKSLPGFFTQLQDLGVEVELS